jgi:transposase
MNVPSSSKITSGPVLIGLDWAQSKHDYCLRTPAGDYETGRIEHDDIKLRQWVDSLVERFPGHQLCLCVEGGRDALLWRLENDGRVDVFIVNPATSSRYRKTFSPSGDKNDQRDAAAILDLFERHPDKVKPYRRAAPEARALHQLSLARRQAVDERTSVIARLREILDLYYPVASKLFDDLSSSLAQAFLRRWPDPISLAKTREKTLIDFFHEHRSRSKRLLERRLELISQNVSLTEDGLLVEVGRLRMNAQLSQIKALNDVITQYEKRIGEVFASHEKKDLFCKLPGAGSNLAPRLLSAFCLIDPKDAVDLQTFAGIAPIRLQSGQSCRTYMRRLCPRFLRQTFHEFAGCSVNSSAWAKAFYDYQTKVKRKGAQAAKRALAFKWMRILFACWKENKPYNESIYTESLILRKSPLAELIFQN